MKPPKSINHFDLSVLVRAVKKLFMSDEFFDVIHIVFPQRTQFKLSLCIKFKYSLGGPMRLFDA